MLPLRISLVLSPYLGATLASVLSARPHAVDLQARATAVNGTCISAPDASCVALVGLCIAHITSGQTGSTAYWTDNICVAAATCATMGSVLDAACCAGTCRNPTDIGSLDVNTVYKSMVGSGCTSSQPQTCTLTWQPFVDWFYNTIQGTGTNLYPASGNDVLSRWQDIATWTGFCTGDSCVDGAIPYSNFNGWLHFSSAIIATSPGTPQYVPEFSTLDENLDNLTPNILWPCLLDEEDDCWWDYGPPPPGTIQGDTVTTGVVSQAVSPAGQLTVNLTKVTAPLPFPFGQPPELPPPVYVNGSLFPLVLNGTLVQWNVTSTRRAVDAPPELRDLPTVDAAAAPKASANSSDTSGGPGELITPAICKGSLDIPTTLPTLTYYCPFFPGICQNIRSHPEWDPTTDMMELTYDPFDGGKRRNEVCTTEVKQDFQQTGSCDPRQHNTNYWKVSCDEFPFSSTLEGGGNGNSVRLAVTNAEQDLQGTLQSSITYLRRVQTNGKTSWGKASQCHRYQIKLADTIPAGAPPSAIGSLDPGSQFFATSGVTFKYVTNRNALTPIPPSFTVDTPYDPSETALTVPKLTARFNCAPCPPSPRSDDEPEDDDDGDTTGIAQSMPTPTSAPSATESAQLFKRQASSCTAPAPPALPTTSAGASAIAAASASSASAAADAAAAALASATNASAAEAASAAAAVSAATTLGPAAAAMAEAASDAALAAAIASSQSAVSSAQSALSDIFSLGPDLPDWLSSIVDHVSSSSSSVSDAVSASSNVITPGTPIPPVVDPSKDPIINSGPPPGTPAAACFGAGSQGFIKVNGLYLIDGSGKAPATLLDEGSDAYFGLEFPSEVQLAPLDGCNSVYGWVADTPQADFQVDCSTMELGSYWAGVKQQCYSYADPTGSAVFEIICGNSIGNVYACIQQLGMYGTVNPVTFTWATS